MIRIISNTFFFFLATIHKEVRMEELLTKLSSLYEEFDFPLLPTLLGLGIPILKE